MKKACEFIIQDYKKFPSEGMFVLNDKIFAKSIIKALKLIEDNNVDDEAFRVHSKGQGLICIE